MADDGVAARRDRGAQPGLATGMGSSLPRPGGGAGQLRRRGARAGGPAAGRRRVGASADRRACRAAGIAVAAYDGSPRNPVLIAREHWPGVVELAVGDVGARPFLRRIRTWSRRSSAATPAGRTTWIPAPTLTGLGRTGPAAP